MRTFSNTSIYHKFYFLKKLWWWNKPLKIEFVVQKWLKVQPYNISSKNHNHKIFINASLFSHLGVFSEEQAIWVEKTINIFWYLWYIIRSTYFNLVTGMRDFLASGVTTFVWTCLSSVLDQMTLNCLMCEMTSLLSPCVSQRSSMSPKVLLSLSSSCLNVHSKLLIYPRTTIPNLKKYKCYKRCICILLYVELTLYCYFKQNNHDIVC